MLRKLFQPTVTISWTILEKETVDEIIFKIHVPRDRLLVELMARGGLRVSEALKLTPRDVEDRRLILRERYKALNPAVLIPHSDGKSL